MSHRVRNPSTINMTTDDPVIQEVCRQSFHNNGQMVDLLGKKFTCMKYIGRGDTFELREVFIVQTAKPEVAEWSGEGLPPVGTACEWNPNQDGWVQVEILGHDGEETWFRRAGQSISETCLRMAFFRPIRTLEQIAAEERAIEVRRILDAMPNDVISGHTGAIVEWMLADGYRKFEIVEGEK